MKKRLLTVTLALVLILTLAACQSQNPPVTGGPVQEDPIPTDTQALPPVADPLPQENPTGTAAATTITKEDAIKLALDHAGFSQADVTGLKAELDRDDGVTHYDVEFYKDGKEYDYEIHAEDGTILEPVQAKQTEDKPASTTKTETKTDTKTTTTTNTKELTKDQAIAKALSHAGLNKSQVTRLQAEKDRDDGVVHYDVEFDCDGYEYDYEVHAQSGKILKAEKDRD